VALEILRFGFLELVSKGILASVSQWLTYQQARTGKSSLV